jgi:antagonist of KipI
MTLVQDRGRVGFQQLGVSVSGAVDVDALDIGNRLVGNQPDDAGLEMLLGGVEIEFSEPSYFALTGADTGAMLDGAPIAVNLCYYAHSGSRLTTGMAVSGLRAYLAVAGGLIAPSTLGSRSTHVASEIGGIDGRPLRAGDVIEIGPADGQHQSGLSFETEEPIAVGDALIIRVILGPQDDEFSSAGIETFLGSTYTVTDQSNRQGLRLDGSEIESKSGRYDIISDAVVNGSIQIPGDGKPIILLADRQTTGGYAKIATVATVDLAKLGQAAPGTTITFVSISVEESQDLLAARMEAIYKSELVRVVEPYSLKVGGVVVSVGVAENGIARVANVEGNVYPIIVDENTPAE